MTFLGLCWLQHFSGDEAADPGHGARVDEEREGPGGERGLDRGHQVQVGHQQLRASGRPKKSCSVANKLWEVKYSSVRGVTSLFQTPQGIGGFATGAWGHQAAEGGAMVLSRLRSC